MIFFLKDNKKAFILRLNLPKVTAYSQYMGTCKSAYTKGYALNWVLTGIETSFCKIFTKSLNYVLFVDENKLTLLLC